ncbi:MAG: hypothetical protein WB762_24460 [Candidatus Sulfotelmatobacter sp.]
MSIRFWIYKESAATSGNAEEGPQYSLTGTFLIDPKTHTPERWELVYDYESDTVAMDVLQDELPDSDIFTSEVYSLVDFSPGAIAAAPDILTGASCEDFMRHGIKNCAEEVDDALLELTLDRLQLFFRYPKTLLFSSDSSMQCDYASRRFLTLWLPSDIEATPSRLGQPSSKVIQGLAEAGKKPLRRYAPNLFRAQGSLVRRPVHVVQKRFLVLTNGNVLFHNLPITADDVSEADVWTTSHLAGRKQPLGAVAAFA